MLLYDGHMDTVLPTEGAWPAEPHAAEVKDGVLYGLGACDMKGSVAAMVYAAKRLLDAETPLQGSLVMAFVVQEEPYEGCALRECLEETQLKPDWVLLGEPSDLAIMRGHRGRVMFRVTVKGEGSHGSRPDLGTNAISNAARVVFGVDMMAGDMANDPFLGPGTAAITHIESHAASRNAIPARCDLYVDRRLTLGETVNRAQIELESLIAREGLEATIEVCETEVTSYTGHTCHAREAHNPGALDPKHPLLTTLCGIVERIVGEKPPVSSWGFSTDGVYSMGQARIPTIGFGPGNPDHAHTLHDQVRLTDVAIAAHVYAALAATLLG
jgi:putative selenium metabolism hydrolase